MLLRIEEWLRLQVKYIHIPVLFPVAIRRLLVMALRINVVFVRCYINTEARYVFFAVCKGIKQASFQLARLRWPRAKIFSLTSGAAVMKMNTELGYVPVTFNELTDDEAFWKGCEGCINHEILMAKDRKFCICTAMLYDPTDPHNIKKEQERNNI